MNKIRYTLTVAVVLIAAGVIYNTDKIAMGIKRGIELCINAVIPSLFLFTVICVFIVNAELFRNNKLMGYISYVIFGVKGEIGAISLLSMICGYPVGGALINELYLKGRITKNCGKSMLKYCINAGPAFIIGVVGNGLYHNISIGVIILISSILSTIISCRIILNNLSIIQLNQREEPRVDYLGAFLRAVNVSVKNMGIVCGWVLVSSAITEVISGIKWLKLFSCFLEVTAGVVTAAENYSIYFVAFLIGFGGVSVHLQAMSAANRLAPSYHKILYWKLIQGAMTSAFTFILLKVFPQTINVSAHITNFNPSAERGNIFTSTVTVLFIISTIIFSNQKINKCGKM